LDYYSIFTVAIGTMRVTLCIGLEKINVKNFISGAERMYPCAQC